MEEIEVKKTMELASWCAKRSMVRGWMREEERPQPMEKLAGPGEEYSRIWEKASGSDLYFKSPL